MGAPPPPQPPISMGQNQKWLHIPCLLRGPKSGQNCYVTPALLGVPRKGDKIKAQHSKEKRGGGAILPLCLHL